jgi:WD40 repeat protein
MSDVRDPVGSLPSGGSAPKVSSVWVHADRPSSLLRAFVGHTQRVNAVIFAAGGRIVSTSEDGTMRVWEVETGRELDRLAGHDGPVNAMVLSPDGAMFATGGDDGWVGLYDAHSLARIGHLECADEHVRDVAIGRRLVVAGSEDNCVYVWDRETKRCLWVLRGHEAMIRGVALSPDERWALSFSIDHDVLVWNLETGRNEGRLYGEKSYAVQLGGGIYFDLPNTSGEGHERAPRRMVFPSNETLISIGDAIIGWDWPKRAQTFRTKGGWPYEAAVIAGDVLLAGAIDVQVLDLATGSRVGRLPGLGEGVTAIAFDPVHRIVAVGGQDGALEVRRLDRSTYVDGQVEPIFEVAVCASARTAATSDSSATVRLWNLDTGAPIATIEDHPSHGTRPMGFSRDGKHLVTTGDAPTATLWIWDARTGAPRHVVASKDKRNEVHAFDCIGERAVLGHLGEGLFAWNLASDPYPETFDGRTSQVSRVCLAADEKTVVTTGYFGDTDEFGDATSRIQAWSLPERRLLWTRAPVTEGFGKFDGPSLGEPTIVGAHVVFGDGESDHLALWDLVSGERECVFDARGYPTMGQALDENRSIVVVQFAGDDDSVPAENRIVAIDTVTRTALSTGLGQRFARDALSDDGRLYVGVDWDRNELHLVPAVAPTERTVIPNSGAKVMAVAAALVERGTYAVVLGRESGQVESLRVHLPASPERAESRTRET